MLFRSRIGYDQSTHLSESGQAVLADGAGSEPVVIRALRWVSASQFAPQHQHCALPGADELGQQPYHKLKALPLPEAQRCLVLLHDSKLYAPSALETAQRSTIG